MIVSYEALMADWRPAVEALGSSIPIAWPRSLAEVQSDIGSFVDGELQHHAPSLGDLASRREIPDCVKGAYAALLALEANPDDATAIAKLDEVQSMFDSAAAIFGAATFPEIGARENVFARVRKSQAEEIDALAAMAQGREEEIVRLGAALATREDARRAQSGEHRTAGEDRKAGVRRSGAWRSHFPLMRTSMPISADF